MRFVLTVSINVDASDPLHKTLMDEEASLGDVTATMLSEALMDASGVRVLSVEASPASDEED